MNKNCLRMHGGLVDEKAQEMGYKVYRPDSWADHEGFWRLVHEYKLPDPGTIQIILWAGPEKPGWLTRQQDYNSQAPYYDKSLHIGFTAF